MAKTVPSRKGPLGGSGGVLCNRITHRSAVSANDSGFPETDATSIDCSYWGFCIVECVLTGTAFNITPGFFDGTNWFRGQTRHVTENTRFILDCTGADTLYILIDGEEGTSTITVYVTPFNYE